MRRTALGKAVLAGLVLFAGAAPAGAQLPPWLERCLHPPGLAEQLEEAQREQVRPRYVIDAVALRGQFRLDAAAREELLASLRGREFNARARWLEEVELIARDVWQESGYYRAVVRVSARRISAEPPHYTGFAVTLDVEEGPQFRLAEIRIRTVDAVCEPVFPPQELRRLVPLADGDIFDVSKVREGLAAQRRHYGAHGYIDFTANPLVEADEAEQTILLTLELDEQKQYFVERVEVLGLDPEIERQLRWRLKPGDVFDSRQLEAFFEVNRELLPAYATLVESLELRRNVRTGRVSLTFDFRPPRGCPAILPLF